TWTGGVAAANQFNDGYPLLVIGTGSLDQLNARLEAAGRGPVGIERFRPNIVLSGLEPHDEDRLDVMTVATEDGAVELKPAKPCPRCPIPNVDPATAAVDPIVTDTLQGYRRNDLLGGAVSFGMNVVVLQGFDRTLRVGQAVGADWKFD
ncbi:MAG: MOSC domain-containing protein, partial [Comamonadaceae bacterium]